MRKINVAGLGPGNIKYFTQAGIDAVKSADIIIGGKRHLEDISIFTNETQEKYILESLSEMLCFVNENKEKEITFIVSGDTGFYSLLNYLKRNLPNENFNVISGLSSFQYLFAKLGESWENYNLYSVHGREIDIIEALNNSTSGIVLLTDNKNSPYYIGRILMKNNFSNVKIVVGENLSYSDERITEFWAKDFEKYNRDYKMNVVILKKEK